MIVDIPADFIRTTKEVHGEAGERWLEQLPGLLAACARRWSLKILPPFAGLSYNYVAPAVRLNGAEVILKAGVPNRELLAEIAALEWYAGRGAVQLLAADPEKGLLLLERLRPGAMLVELDDDKQATAIAAQVMRRLWRPAPPGHHFPTIADWAAGLGRLRDEFDGGAGPFPARLVSMAEGLFTELIASQGEPVLLHGDLHHYNILAAERQPWLAIDPKGLVGEPEYEVGALLRNPSPQMSTNGRILARRLDQLAAELGFDRARLAGWSLAQAVLSAWWSYEDHGHGWEAAIACAQALADFEA
jgi:streptomycin 6-kinase